MITTARYPYGGNLLKVQQYQDKMGFDIAFFFTEHNLQVLFLYLFTYFINANSKIPYLPFSFKIYVFVVPGGGHL